MAKSQDALADPPPASMPAAPRPLKRPHQRPAIGHGGRRDRPDAQLQLILQKPVVLGDVNLGDTLKRDH